MYNNSALINLVYYLIITELTRLLI